MDIQEIVKKATAQAQAEQERQKKLAEQEQAELYAAKAEIIAFLQQEVGSNDVRIFVDERYETDHSSVQALIFNGIQEWPIVARVNFTKSADNVTLWYASYGAPYLTTDTRRSMFAFENGLHCAGMNQSQKVYNTYFDALAAYVLDVEAKYQRINGEIEEWNARQESKAQEKPKPSRYTAIGDIEIALHEIAKDTTNNEVARAIALAALYLDYE